MREEGGESEKTSLSEGGGGEGARGSVKGKLPENYSSVVLVTKTALLHSTLCNLHKPPTYLW